MAERRPRVVAVFGEALARPVIQILEMTELGWHDNTGEFTPPEKVIDDILFCSEGDLVKLIEAARLALTDTRDLTMWVARLKASARSK
jgi:hypothetical protein